MNKTKAFFSMFFCFFIIILFFGCEVQEDFEVHTLEVTDVTAHTATVEVEITGGDDADIHTRGVVWGRTSGPERLSPHGPKQIDKETTSRLFASNIAWLSPETVYYVRGYVVTARETIYGEDIHVTTLPVDIDYGTVADADGNEYKTVTIGNQKWMAENLEVTSYEDGTTIPLVTDDEDWADLGSNDKAYSINYDDPEGIYGAYYTWTAATRGEDSESNPSNIQGVCPAGWHIPSDAEWRELDEFVEHNPGQALKATFGWAEDGTGKDVFGFSAFPAGYRSNNTGKFAQTTVSAKFWSSDERQNGDVRSAELSSFENFITHMHGSKNVGKSVRCVKN